MTSLLVIGPTKFADLPQAEIPSWVSTLLHEDEPGNDLAAPSPLGVRRAIARRLVALRVPATVMEDHPQVEGESRNGKFDRVVREAGIDTYLTYWPYGGTLLGIAWELSHLTRRIQDEEDELEATALPVYVETGVGSWDLETGRFTFREEGNRTTYFEDLWLAGCPIFVWGTYDELWEAIESRFVPSSEEPR